MQGTFSTLAAVLLESSEALVMEKESRYNKEPAKMTTIELL